MLVLLAGAVIWRAATEATPPLVVQRTLGTEVRFPGATPVLAWPREGQAAVEIEGLGSFGAIGGETPVPIASVAKVMTAYLTLREHPLAAGEGGFVMRITPAEVEEQEQRAALGESTVTVRAGERITEREALEALLLPSANNIAALLAMHEPGGLAAFVARMNSTARKLGMDSSTYTDPSGFDDTTVSTAVDQLKLARVAMRIPTFAEIVDEPAAELPGVGRIANYDDLLGTGGYVGVKTGSDRAAGGCFVFAKEIAIGNRRLLMLGVVLGQRGSSLIEAALVSAGQLGNSAAASLHVRTVLPAGSSVVSASSVDGRATTGVTVGALREIGWGGVELPVQIVVRPSMTHLRAGESMAAVRISGPRAARTRAVAAKAVGGPSIGWRLRHLF